LASRVRAGLRLQPTRASCRKGNDRMGLALLGVRVITLVEREVYERIKAEALQAVRGTVQADILKEDQRKTPVSFDGICTSHDGRRAAVFSSSRRSGTSTRCPSPVITLPKRARIPFRSWPSRSPTGFTIVEYYLARGLKIDDFAPNLSFFFQMGWIPNMQ